MPLSQKQMEYLALAWQCFETEPKIDYAHFATVAGLASPHSARELMRVTKNKLKTEYGALSGGMRSANAVAPNLTTPNRATDAATPTPNKRSKASASASAATPVNRKRRTMVSTSPRSAAKPGGGSAGRRRGAEIDDEPEASELNDEDGGAEESPSKKARVKKEDGQEEGEVIFGGNFAWPEMEGL